MSTDVKIISATILVSAIILAVGVFFALRQSAPSVPESEIVAKDGLHWHPTLAIVVKGKKQEIQKDIGIGAVHQPIHTHDSTGTIHMEMSGLITKEDTKLGNFFRIWGEEFSSTKIFDNTNGRDGKVKMLVNGKGNGSFENYLMKDKDKIEIIFD